MLSVWFGLASAFKIQCSPFSFQFDCFHWCVYCAIRRTLSVWFDVYPLCSVCRRVFDVRRMRVVCELRISRSAFRRVCWPGFWFSSPGMFSFTCEFAEEKKNEKRQQWNFLKGLNLRTNKN